MKRLLQRIKVFSRHPSHNVLRIRLPLLKGVKSLIRLGSVTKPKSKYDVELNSIESVTISSNKKLMKQAFTEANVNTANWIHSNNLNEIEEFFNNGKIVAKSFYGSRGEGNYLLSSIDEFKVWVKGKNISNYIFEVYMPFKLEYRLHVTKNGCFYTCRKALKVDTPEKDRWRRHVDTSVWYREENPNFLRPNSWNDIVDHCKKALLSVGADVLSFDVRVQSPIKQDGSKREYQNFILIECNSASSMSSQIPGDISYCAKKYIEIIPNLILQKYEEQNNG